MSRFSPSALIFQLDQLRDILGLTEQDASYEIVAEVTPLFQATALAAIKSSLDGTLTADEAWEKISARRDELMVDEEASRDLLSSMVMQALGVPLEESNKFSKVNNEAAVYDNILEALEAKQGLISILTKSGWEAFDDFDKTFCDPWNRQSANGFLNSEERIKMYRTFMSRSLRKSPDGKLTDEISGKMAEVKGLLGISDEQAEVEARTTFGPELNKACLRAMTEIVSDYTPELATNLKKEIDGVMENYRLSEDFLRGTGASCYAKAVAQISEKVRLSRIS